MEKRYLHIVEGEQLGNVYLVYSASTSKKNALAIIKRKLVNHRKQHGIQYIGPGVTQASDVEYEFSDLKKHRIMELTTGSRLEAVVFRHN